VLIPLRTRLALGAALWLLTFASPAEAELKAIWGPTTLADGRSAFPIYRDLGVEVLQRQLSWRAVAIRRPARARNPSDRAYRWPAELDATMAAASASGIRIALMVKETPRWAGGGPQGSRAPRDVADYARFLRAASRRYPAVRHWMIWGEPTRMGSFAPMPKNRRRGPRAYASLLDAAYGALKRESKRNIVIGGMTYTIGEVLPADFLRWMRLPGGRRPRLDWYGHNPYSVRFPDLSQDPYVPGLRDFSDIDTLARELRRAYPAQRPRLWLSEFSISSDRANRAFSFFLSRAEQARWLTAAFRIAHAHRYVAGLGWYSLLDEIDRPGSLTTGLMTAAAQPKPAYRAYKRAP
jgi:hypothetical protein